MGFGGHVQDMINRDKQNRAMRTSRKERINRSKRLSSQKHKSTRSTIQLNRPINAETSSEMKHRISKNLKRDRMNRNMKVLFVFTILAGLIIWLLYGMIFA
ncbi:hypothetical protein [Salinivirga cyanobacteriivorans]